MDAVRRESDIEASHDTKASVSSEPTSDSPPVPTPDEERNGGPPTTRRHEEGFVELPVPGFLSAVTYLPRREAIALVVATHGAGGSPEWECEYWYRLSRGGMQLLCLRGTSLGRNYPGSFYYENHLRLEAEFKAALRAFEGGTETTPKVLIYAGFSQGAIMGAPMIVAHASRFSRLVLIEGGFEYWSRGTARKFAKNGGKKVLFLCGTGYCNSRSRVPADWLASEGVDVRLEHVTGAGHTPAGEVMQRLEAQLPWIVE
ncbi:MAG TPA: hypothetical protein VFQ61_27910 [Polyangiaceae bacterium]|nr:hypothetical protein [Polyangiaceae bacterium]